MSTRDTEHLDVHSLAEEHFVEAYANLDECVCAGEHALHVALSEQRGTPRNFAPDHKGIEKAYCGTFGRRCGFK